MTDVNTLDVSGWTAPTAPPGRTPQIVEAPSILDVVTLLNRLSRDYVDEYHKWIRVGMALHNVFGGSPVALEVWRDFSRQSNKYEPGCCESKWDTFGGSDRRLGLGSLRHWVGETDGPRYEVMDWAQFRQADYSRNFLIDKCFIEHQPLIISGHMKTLKTTLLMDAAISLATGSPFLGQFECEKRRVLYMSGESGGWALQETAFRQAKAKGVEPDADSLHISEDLPRFASESDLSSLGKVLRDREIEVLFIDPAYICMLGGDASQLASNGGLLFAIGDMCRRQNITLGIATHNKKTTASESRLPRMDDISGAGYGEWGRQFWLLARASEYVRGSGHHDLWFAVDGSAGTSMAKHLSIDEGPPPSAGQPRKWKVAVRDESDIRADQTAMQEIATRSATTTKVLAALQDGPLHCSAINEAITGRVKKAFLDTLVEDGELEHAQVSIPREGQPPRLVQGYQIAT